MPIYHKHKLIHIHIPKTGGTAISAYFRSVGDMPGGIVSWIGEQMGNGRWWEFQHLSLQEIDKLSGGAYGTYGSFCVVRDPYMRLVSDYEWRRAAIEFGQPDPGPRFDTFASFIEAIPDDIDSDFDTLVRAADRRQANFLIHVRPQYQYVAGRAQSSGVDRVFKYETLDSDLREIGVTLSPARTKTRDIFRDFYDRKTLRRVNELFSKDFAAFCYPMA